MPTTRTSHSWAVETWKGDAHTHHARPMPEAMQRSVWIHELNRPALVLGSAQPWSTVEPSLPGKLGVELVRRRSGGGAVFLLPGDVAWVDVLLPSDDELWEDDISRSGFWLGQLWCSALADLGLTGGEVHTGRLELGELGRLVCFGAVGPGEVTLDGRKLVGVSQRRNRHGARFQCAVYHTWSPGMLAHLLGLEPAAAQPLTDMAVGSGIAPARMVDAFLTRLHATT